MTPLRHVHVHVLALLALVLSALAPAPVSGAGETVILCAPDGPREVTLPGPSGAPPRHDCLKCCLATIGLPGDGTLALPEPAAIRPAPVTTRGAPARISHIRTNFARAPPLSA